jgi:hypothetical protein
MNMTAYQEFVRIFNFVKKNNDSKAGEYAIRQSLPLIRKKYADKGITNDELIVADEVRKKGSQSRETDLYLQTARVFEIEDKHKYLLMATNNPKSDDVELFSQVRLPFPEIFIDVDFDVDDLNGAEGSIHGILIRELKELAVVSNPSSKDISRQILYGLTAYVSGTSVEGFPFIDRFYFPIVGYSGNTLAKMDFIDAEYDNKKEAKFIKKFIVNFLLFLKSREVVYIESHRDANNRAKRVKAGKMPLPSSHIIQVTGELKRYINGLTDADFRRGHLSGKWEVMGHDRHYRADRYVNMKGKIQWIDCYKKGTGIEVKHVYRVIPNDEKDTLNYDDIEASKKPMRK